MRAQAERQHRQHEPELEVAGVIHVDAGREAAVADEFRPTAHEGQ
jgi:hypothetical protein